MAINQLLQPTLHFVTGKGGVGKSVIAQGLAELLAQKGFNTLWVELKEEANPEKIRRPAVIEQCGNNLNYLKIYPDQALYEYLHLKIPASQLVEKLFTKNFFRVFSALMPGLSDLTRLGKIWFHADPQAKSSQLFQKVVVDLPSSGFTDRFLSIAQVVHDVVKIGPIAHEAGLIQEFLGREGIVHLVTLPKELVVNETIETYGRLQQSAMSKMGILFINRVLEISSQELLDYEKKCHGLNNTLEIMRFFLERAQEEERQRERLKQELNSMPICLLKEYLALENNTPIKEHLKQKIMVSDV